METLALTITGPDDVTLSDSLLQVAADMAAEVDSAGTISDIESDEFYAAEQRVDLEAGYTFRNGLKAFAAVTNLTDEPQVSYQGYRQFVEDASLSGRKFNIGLEFSF